MLTGTDTVVIERATEFGILPAEIIVIGFHSETFRADRNTVRVYLDSLVI